MGNVSEDIRILLLSTHEESSCRVWISFLLILLLHDLVASDADSSHDRDDREADGGYENCVMILLPS